MFQVTGVSEPHRTATAAKIVIRNLTKSFWTRHGETQALTEINLAVDDAEFLSIVGPSGCGKTTLLRILAGLEAQTTGTFEIGRDDPRRPLNAMVFQEHSLLPWLTVLDNAAFGLEMRGVSRAERHEKAQAFLEVVGLTGFSQHYPNQLSGGMKQRVSLVRAFVNDPEILLMDEPFAALDAQNKIILQDELIRICEASRKTVVYVTHSIEEALVLSDRIVVMTSTPGSIKDTVHVDFSHPRDTMKLRSSAKFGEMAGRIWSTLESEVLKAREAQS